MKCEDAESNTFGKEIWMVDNYQLINKYVMERDDPCLGRIFIKTDKVGAIIFGGQMPFSIPGGCRTSRGRTIW